MGNRRRRRNTRPESRFSDAQSPIGVALVYADWLRRLIKALALQEQRAASMSDDITPRGAEARRLPDRAFVPKPDVIGRLRDALGLLDAVEHGELLVNCPADRSERARHEAGLAVLSVLHRDLERLLAEVCAHEDLTGYSAIEAAVMGLRSPTGGG